VSSLGIGELGDVINNSHRFIVSRIAAVESARHASHDHFRIDHATFINDDFTVK
jgi:hypothetical protein